MEWVAVVKRMCKSCSQTRYFRKRYDSGLVIYECIYCGKVITKEDTRVHKETLPEVLENFQYDSGR
jgi:uncharacterized Zn finger protein